MKKAYIKPSTIIIEVDTESIIAASAPHIGGSADPGYGADAPSRRGSDWDNYEN